MGGGDEGPRLAADPAYPPETELERFRAELDQASQAMKAQEAFIGEQADEIRAMRAKRRKAGSKRKPDDQLSDRAMRDRKKEAREHAEAEARRARLAPSWMVRCKLHILDIMDIKITDEDESGNN